MTQRGAAADPPGLCGLGLPSCCRAGTGTVSSERFPSRGLRIMHLEQHSLIQVCDLSENQIPVISPAIWPPRTRWGGGSASLPEHPPREGQSGLGLPGVLRGRLGRKCPRKRFWEGAEWQDASRTWRTQLRAGTSLCPTHPWRLGQDLESSNLCRDGYSCVPTHPWMSKPVARMDILVSHIPGCRDEGRTRRAPFLAGTWAGGGDGEEVTTPALPRGHPGSRDVPWPSREGRREQDPCFPPAGVAQRGAGAPSIPLPAPHSQLIKALPLF